MTGGPSLVARLAVGVLGDPFFDDPASEGCDDCGVRGRALSVTEDFRVGNCGIGIVMLPGAGSYEAMPFRVGYPAVMLGLWSMGECEGDEPLEFVDHGSGDEEDRRGPPANLCPDCCESGGLNGPSRGAL